MALAVRSAKLDGLKVSVNNMREILFRGFHECENGKSKAFVKGEWINGEWVYGWYYSISKSPLKPIVNGSYIQTFKKLDNGEIILTGNYEVIPSTVGQYTGLQDISQNKAFKGDISTDSQNRKWVIFCCDGGFGICRDNEWAVTNGNPVLYVGLSEKQNASWFTSDHKIIGNIHDNPELLEVKE